MAAFSWKHDTDCGDPNCTLLLVDGEYTGVGTFSTARPHIQWHARKGRKQLTGLESSLVAAQDMALREAGLLADVKPRSPADA
jgi:hypothetical protein